MKNHINKIVLFYFIISILIVEIVQAQTITRGPYLQVGKQDSITIRWRTDIATNSNVTWGTSYIASPGTYANSYAQDVATTVTEHVVRIGGLAADTKYWYTIGSTTTVLQQTNDNYFLTLPLDNTTRKLRFLALGDCGNNSVNQVNVKNTFINYIGTNDIDAMILLGDNAYTTGTDAEFQTNFFDVYKDDLLKYNKLYPAPGNHDYGNSLANTGSRTMPYHLNFTVPMAGEIGGVASGVSNYYSFNVGNVHFISMDSYGKDDANTTNLYDTTGAQATWLKADLAANTKQWTVAYFHHPPYTKTSHNSDTESDLIAVREKFVRILERYGVDLILCGHSHGYERSYLLKGFYNTYATPLLDGDFNAMSHTATGNTQNGKYDGTVGACAYAYNSGQYNHGSVYVVSGSAGQLGGTSAGYPHDAMYYSNSTNGGCFYFEVDSNRLDAKFISYTTAPTPVIRDQFTIFKDVNKTQNFNVVQNQPLTLSASWRGAYYWPNNGGATTRNVTITNPTIGTYKYTAEDASTSSCIQDTFNVYVSVALPIALSSFDATLNRGIVSLDWTTAHEQNNNYFTIEKSSDGRNFSFLGIVKGWGTSTTTNHYHFADNNPSEGVNYYQLSQTDFDGNSKHCGVKVVNYENNKELNTKVFNDGAGRISVVIHSKKTTNIRMKIVDMLGKDIMQDSFFVNSGRTTKAIYLNSGTYILVLFNDSGERISDKIIVR